MCRCAESPSHTLPYDRVRLNPERYELDTGEVGWTGFKQGRGVFVVCSPSSKVAVGFLVGRTLDLGERFLLKCMETPLGGFGVFVLTILERGVRWRGLMTCVSTAENTD